MNKKLTNYVNGLFSDYPNSKKARELKEEILLFLKKLVWTEKIIE